MVGRRGEKLVSRALAGWLIHSVAGTQSLSGQESYSRTRCSPTLQFPEKAASPGDFGVFINAARQGFSSAAFVGAAETGSFRLPLFSSSTWTRGVSSSLVSIETITNGDRRHNSSCRKDASSVAPTLNGFNDHHIFFLVTSHFSFALYY